MLYYLMSTTLFRVPFRECMIKPGTETTHARDVRWNTRRPSGHPMEHQTTASLRPKRLCRCQKGTPVLYRRTAFVADRDKQVFLRSQKGCRRQADLADGEVGDAPNAAPRIQSNTINTVRKLIKISSKSHQKNVPPEVMSFVFFN